MHGHHPKICFIWFTSDLGIIMCCLELMSSKNKQKSITHLGDADVSLRFLMPTFFMVLQSKLVGPISSDFYMPLPSVFQGVQDCRLPGLKPPKRFRRFQPFRRPPRQQLLQLPCLVEPNHCNDTNGILILLWLRRFWLIVGVDEGFDPERVEWSCLSNIKN